MLNFIKNKKNISHGWLLDVAIIFFIVLVLMTALLIGFEKKYKDKIYPGVTVGNIDLDGRPIRSARTIINEKINEINQDGITFYYGNKETIVKPIIASLESDLAYEIINFDAENTVLEAYNFGREDNFFVNLQNKLKSLFFKKQINLHITINDEQVEEALRNNFSELEIPAENAKLVSKKKIYLGGMENFQFDVQKEKLGKTIDYKKGISQLKKQLAQINNNSIELFTSTDYPTIYKKDALNIENKAQNIVALAPLVLKHDKQEWKLNKAELAGWLTLKNETAEDNDIIKVSINSEVVQNYLKEKIAPEINQEPIEAKFEIKNGRVTKFQASRDGITLNTEATFSKIEFEFIKNEQKEIDLVVEELKSNSSIEDVNDIGIKETVGIGESDFSGSPANRRHNISIGANTLNGIIIKPDEEFSLMGTLGEIDGSAGYKQELVIKDNKTIPEYGGGLCQIGTTMFRAALASGLPITMRRNHSYRVSYYEPAGTDATIYDPWPDLRFINDTGNNILIQSRIEGNNLYFDFWGTNDGRIAERTDPIIYNIVKPPPTKFVETLDLKPGEKKCTEHAHNGADAYFDYKVTYQNGEAKTERFNSHYVPWQEVCLIGVEELSEPEKSATSTEEAIE